MPTNSIKFNLAVLKALHQTRMYIRKDNFEATETASPGFIMYQHPTTTRGRMYRNSRNNGQSNDTRMDYKTPTRVGLGMQSNPRLYTVNII
eukprot:15332756-Ditylum_brightwellii.AAC.1